MADEQVPQDQTDGIPPGQSQAEASAFPDGTLGEHPDKAVDSNSSSSREHEEHEDVEEAVQPITPEEIGSAKAEVFPGRVMTAFNALIAESAVNGVAKVKQEDVIKRMIESGLDPEEITRRGWLNVEDVYREAGWEVEYDKPGYNETYPATFTFRARE